MRKEAGFEVTDKIRVCVKGNEVIANIMKTHTEAVCSDVLANEVLFDTVQGYEKEWNINSEKVTLAVEKLN